MKKISLALKILFAVAVIATVGFFARNREVHVGTLIVDDQPLAGVKVRLYKKNEVEGWLQNDFVASFLHWRERKQELSKLEEIHGKHEILFLEKKAAVHEALGDYKTARSLGYTAVTFPDALFRQMRADLPSDFFLPSKSLFAHRKKSDAELQKDNFFKELETEFKSISQYNLNQIQQKFEQESWDKNLGYQPDYPEEDAKLNIRNLGQLDKLAEQLQQIALNDREVQHLAPLPLLETTTDANGHFQFAISRYSKKLNAADEYIIAAVANPSPRRRIAWLRSTKLGIEARTQAKALLFQFGEGASPWGYYHKQAIELTGDNTLADVSSLDNMADLPEIVPMDAPTPPLVFEKPASDYNLLEAIALLTNKTAGHHGEDAHGSHGDDHGGHGSQDTAHHGHPEEDTHTAPTEHVHDNHGADTHSTGTDHPSPSETAHKHAPAPAVHEHATPPPPATPATPAPHPVETLAPDPETKAIAPSPTSTLFPHFDIIGTWESKADPTQVASISFTEDGTFTMKIDGMALPGGKYSIDALQDPHLVTITKKDASKWEAKLIFSGTDTIQFDGETYSKQSK